MISFDRVPSGSRNRSLISRYVTESSFASFDIKVLAF